MKSFNSGEYDVVELPPQLGPPSISLRRNLGLICESIIVPHKPIYGEFPLQRFNKIKNSCADELTLIYSFNCLVDIANHNSKIDGCVNNDLNQKGCMTTNAAMKENSELPPVPDFKAKDGDAKSLHANHNVVKAMAGGKSYDYCRDCKVEVVEEPKLIDREDEDLFSDLEHLSAQDWGLGI